MMPLQVHLNKDKLESRVKSFVRDNYMLQVNYISPELCYVKLRHRMNGNVVVISANLCSDYMQQKTNGKVTYSGIIQP